MIIIVRVDKIPINNTIRYTIKKLENIDKICIEHQGKKSAKSIQAKIKKQLIEAIQKAKFVFKEI